MKKLLCFLIILFVFFYLPAFSQEDQADSTGAAVDTLTLDFGLFNSDEILNLSLLINRDDLQILSPHIQKGSDTRPV